MADPLTPPHMDLYLVYFGAGFELGICYLELESLLRSVGVEHPERAYVRRPATFFPSDDPFVVVKIPSFAAAKAVCERGITILALDQILASGNTLHDAAEALGARRGDIAPLLDKSWSMAVCSFRARGLTTKQMESIRRHVLQIVPFTGPVDIKNAVVPIKIYLDFPTKTASVRPRGTEGLYLRPMKPLEGDEREAAPSPDALLPPTASEQEAVLLRSTTSAAKEDGTGFAFDPEACTGLPFACVSSCVACLSPGPGEPPRRNPTRVFITREVGRSNRALVPELALNKRAYLGPTSLDAELALTMCNIGGVRRGSVLYDPFVGTGSVLVAGAKLGAFTFGSDIDAAILAGRDGKNMASSFAQYGLGVPEVLRMDNSNTCLRELELLDAIVTDPPYGVRAGAFAGANDHCEGGGDVEGGAADAATAAATAAAPAKGGPFEVAAQRIATCHYDDVMLELLDTAARMLVMGGRLVYLYPAPAAGYTPAELPAHPCLRLVGDGEQRLTMMLSRHVIVMEKITPYDAAAAAAGVYRAYAQEALRAAGVAGVSLRKRLGNNYQTWFAAHKGEYAGMAKVLEAAKTKALNGKPRKEGGGGAGEAKDGADGASSGGSDEEEEGGGGDGAGGPDFSGVSRAQLKRFRRRLQNSHKYEERKEEERQKIEERKAARAAKRQAKAAAAAAAAAPEAAVPAPEAPQ